MNVLVNIWDWIAKNWVQLGVALWLIEQGMRAISELTPWKWDDNIVKVVTNILKQVFPKKPDNPNG